MKRENLKKTLSIIAVILFSLSIIGGIVLSIVLNKRDTASAAVAVEQSQIRYSAGLDMLGPITITEFDDIFIDNPKDYGTYTDINGFKRIQSYWTNSYSGKPLLIGDISDWSELLVYDDPWNLYYGQYYADDDIIFYPVGGMQPYDVPDFGWFGGILGVFLYYYNPDFSDSYDNGYTDGWTNGYNQGYNEGTDYGYSEGVNVGREEGYCEGYDSGYTAGLLAGMEDADEVLQQEYQDLLDRYNDLLDDYTHAVDNLDEYRDEIEQLNKEIEAFQSQIASLEATIADLKSQLDNSQGGGSGGDYMQGYDDGFMDGLNNGLQIGDRNGYERGYNEGLAEGHDTAYNAGYLAGLNKAQSDSLKNPVTYILTPVHEFMNMNLFGVVSLGTIFNIILFVSLALIFIKMFSGG